LHSINACNPVVVQTHSFLTSAQEGSHCLPALISRFKPEDKSVGTTELEVGWARGGSTNCIQRLVRYRISCVQVVCFMRISCVPSRQSQAYELHQNIWVYKVLSNLNVLRQFYCTWIYTQLYGHIQNCWMISTIYISYDMLLSHV